MQRSKSAQPLAANLSELITTVPADFEWLHCVVGPKSWPWHTFSRWQVSKCEYLENGGSYRKWSITVFVEVDVPPSIGIMQTSTIGHDNEVRRTSINFVGILSVRTDPSSDKSSSVILCMPQLADAIQDSLEDLVTNWKVLPLRLDRLWQQIMTIIADIIKIGCTLWHKETLHVIKQTK